MYNKHTRMPKNKTLSINMYRGDFNKCQIREDPEDTTIKGNLNVTELRAPCSTVFVRKLVRKNKLTEEKLELIGDKKSMLPKDAANRGGCVEGCVDLKIDK